MDIEIDTHWTSNMLAVLWFAVYICAMSHRTKSFFPVIPLFERRYQFGFHRFHVFPSVCSVCALFLFYGIADNAPVLSWYGSACVLYAWIYMLLYWWYVRQKAHMSEREREYSEFTWCRHKMWIDAIYSYSFVFVHFTSEFSIECTTFSYISIIAISYRFCGNQTYTYKNTHTIHAHCTANVAHWRLSKCLEA